MSCLWWKPLHQGYLFKPVIGWIGKRFSTVGQYILNSTAWLTKPRSDSAIFNFDVPKCHIFDIDCAISVTPNQIGWWNRTLFVRNSSRWDILTVSASKAINVGAVWDGYVWEYLNAAAIQFETLLRRIYNRLRVIKPGVEISLWALPSKIMIVCQHGVDEWMTW